MKVWVDGPTHPGIGDACATGGNRNVMFAMPRTPLLAERGMNQMSHHGRNFVCASECFPSTATYGPSAEEAE